MSLDLNPAENLCSVNILTDSAAAQSDGTLLRVRLAVDQTNSSPEDKASLERANRGPDGPLSMDPPRPDGPLSMDPPRPHGRLVRVELEWDIPMSVALPVQMQADPARHAFPFLDTTLADLGIQESEVKERVVWVDTRRTQVKSRAGKLKEREVTILEVRVKAQKPGDQQLQEVLYSTESHTDRSFCRTGMNILPWKHSPAGRNGLTPVQLTVASEAQQPDFTEAQDQREIRGAAAAPSSGRLKEQI